MSKDNLGKSGWMIKEMCIVLFTQNPNKNKLNANIFQDTSLFRPSWKSLLFSDLQKRIKHFLTSQSFHKELYFE